MPAGNPSFSPTPVKSLESLKETFKQRLDIILYKQLTVENIETFADDALSGTIKLTEDILGEYKANPNVHQMQIPLDKQLQENEAYAILGLPNISEILQSIINVKEKIDAIRIYISENNEIVDKVITPPQTNLESGNLGTGTGTLEKKKMFPRLLTLLYILEHDFNITPSPTNVPIKEGIVTSSMMRQTPYVRVEIPALGRAVYICDEEGNASYIFDTAKMKEVGLAIENLDLDDKGDKNTVIASHSGIGIRLTQTSHWRIRMAEYLGEIISESQKESERKADATEKTSEFGGERKWLSFEDFTEEIQEIYPGEIAISDWYKGERGKHSNWPSNPGIVYKDKGWVGWPELVGVENITKKDWPDFDTFQKEVRELYKREGQGRNVGEWYKKERIKHPNWHSRPYVLYKGKGWVGWPELVGKENFLKKEFLDFQEFEREVRGRYPGEGAIQDWYQKEKENHKNWPANPDQIYEKVGWVGWPELVGKENPYKQEFLSFPEFQTEVRDLYRGESNVAKWYWEKKGEHPNWPYLPGKEYKGSGWKSWSSLVNKENPKEKEFLTFQDFQAEVLALYPGQGDVAVWYREEKKSHKNWPASPERTFKEKGWKGWSALVGK